MYCCYLKAGIVGKMRNVFLLEFVAIICWFGCFYPLLSEKLLAADNLALY